MKRIKWTADKSISQWGGWVLRRTRKGSATRTERSGPEQCTVLEVREADYTH